MMVICKRWASPELRREARTRTNAVWEIGIVRGRSPLEWNNSGANPVLASAGVTDVEAEFVADPFMILNRRSWYLFFEVLRRDTQRGEIGVAVSSDLLTWNYHKIVLRETFHLSYPYVFEWEGSNFMIPETLGADEVRLYKSHAFPSDWRLVCPIIPGSYADPTIFRHGNRFWMFACDTPYEHRSLRLYSAPRLEGPWEEHPDSPVVENDASAARPAGRVIAFQGRLLRFAQDCSRQYGELVRVFEITHLSRKSYQERMVSPFPIIGPGGLGNWRTSRMHHIDAHLISTGNWVASVDGWPNEGGDVK